VAVTTIIFGLVGGLALFLFGMKLLSEGLQKAAGNRLKNILQNLTNRPIKGIAAGAFITSIIQSSSITTVTIIGLINAGLMTLTQAVSVIMGANIGTTITAQLVAFKIGKYALPIIAVGTLLLFIAKKKKYYYIAQIFLGFGILFLGMSTMSKGAVPLREIPFFINMLTNFGEVVLLGILAGAVFTGIIQSSSATTGLVIALSMEQVIGLKAAIAIIIGANIGTCVTALLASLSSSISAKRAAMIHILFNIIGVAIFIPLIPILTQITQAISGELPRQIANAHTIFNVTNTFVMVPFIPLLVFLVKKIIPGKEYKVDNGVKYLDKRLLNTPALAIAQAQKELSRMARNNFFY
jgi:phosphate:Na+ symporter